MDWESPHGILILRSSPLATAPPLVNVREQMAYSRRLERLWEFIEEHYADPDVHLRDAA